MVWSVSKMNDNDADDYMSVTYPAVYIPQWFFIVPYQLYLYPEAMDSALYR